MRQTIRRSIPRRGSTGRPLLYWKVMDMKGTQAMDHVRDEMASAKNDYVSALGEMMTVYLQRNPEAEIAEDKTLAGAFKHLHSAAQKKQKDRFYAMPPAEAFALMMQYYDQTPADGEFEACMLAVIGQTVPDAPAPTRQPDPLDDLLDLDALLEG